MKQWRIHANIWTDSIPDVIKLWLVYVDIRTRTFVTRQSISWNNCLLMTSMTYCLSLYRSNLALYTFAHYTLTVLSYYRYTSMQNTCTWLALIASHNVHKYAIITNKSRKWSLWWLGIVVTCFIWSTKLQSWVSTWMGDCLQAGKPSQYVTGHLGQLSLPSLQGR